MPDYFIELFWSAEDRCYVADIPDLFPCTGFGETPEQALAELKDAKEAWFETACDLGLPFPAPTWRPEATPEAD